MHALAVFTKYLNSNSCPCSYVVVMPKKRQALVEYEDMSGSCNAVTYANDNQIYIAGNPAFINYSTSQKISRPTDPDDSRSVNLVLLLTIMNPIYPITTVGYFTKLILLLNSRLKLVNTSLKVSVFSPSSAGCLVYHLQQLRSSAEDCDLPEKWSPGYGGIRFGSECTEG